MNPAAASCERADKRCPHPAMCDEYGCAQERARLLGLSNKTPDDAQPVPLPRRRGLKFVKLLTRGH